MKTKRQSIITALTCLITLSLSAQIDVVEGGNVGVGTTTPTHKLDVVGSINFTDSLYQNGAPLDIGGSPFWSGSDTMIGYEGKVGIGTQTPRAALEVNSTTGGLLPPQLTSEQKENIQTPISGTIIFDSDRNCLSIYTGSEWGCLKMELDSENEDGSAEEGVCEGNYSHVSLLLHGDGDLTDASNNNLTVTASGNAGSCATQSKFGGSSLCFDGSGDYLSISNTEYNDEFDFETGDFTVEFWVYFNDFGSTHYGLVGEGLGIDGTGPDKAGWMIWYDTGTDDLTFGTYEGVTVVTRSFDWNPSATTWYHAAVTRTGNDLKAFVDGAQIGSTADVTGIAFDYEHNQVNLGLFHCCSGAIRYLDGYLDDVRVTKGASRYTSNFTVPSEAFGDRACPCPCDIDFSDLVGMTPTGNNIQKTSANAWGNGGFASTNTIPANTDGWVEWEINGTADAYFLGLSSVNADANYTTIEFAVYVHNTSTLGAYDAGVDHPVGTTGYASGDLIRVERIGATVYYKKNGTTFHTSTTTSTTQLIADASFHYQNQQAMNIRMSH